jgi:sec-independent protein translocase protein TatA
MNPFILLGIIGPWEAVLIIVAILLLFGGKKIPEMMKGLGKGARELKKALNEDDEAEKKNDKPDDQKQP